MIFKIKQIQFLIKKLNIQYTYEDKIIIYIISNISQFFSSLE